MSLLAGDLLIELSSSRWNSRKRGPRGTICPETYPDGQDGGTSLHPPPPIERLPAAGTPDPKPASKEAGMEEVMDAITLGDWENAHPSDQLGTIKTRQDLLYQTIRHSTVALMVVAEPYRVLDAPDWVGDTDEITDCHLDINAKGVRSWSPAGARQRIRRGWVGMNDGGGRRVSVDGQRSKSSWTGLVTASGGAFLDRCPSWETSTHTPRSGETAGPTRVAVRCQNGPGNSDPCWWTGARPAPALRGEGAPSLTSHGPPPMHSGRFQAGEWPRGSRHSWTSTYSWRWWWSRPAEKRTRASTTKVEDQGKGRRSASRDRNSGCLELAGLDDAEGNKRGRGGWELPPSHDDNMWHVHVANYAGHRVKQSRVLVDSRHRGAEGEMCRGSRTVPEGPPLARKRSLCATKRTACYGAR